ncbi:MAG: hypothetical protein WBV11_09085 [Salegentibacter sp.]
MDVPEAISDEAGYRMNESGYRQSETEVESSQYADIGSILKVPSYAAQKIFFLFSIFTGKETQDHQNSDDHRAKVSRKN